MTDTKPKTVNVKALIKLIQTNKTNVKNLTSVQIVKVLTKLSDMYHTDGNPMVSDEIYDYIKEYLEEIDPNNNFLLQVGAPIKGTKNKIKLPFEMGSLAKIKPDTGNVTKWTNVYKGPYIISDKLDGASCQLYKSPIGELFLYSRGDGTTGQDISHLITLLFNEDTLQVLPNGTSVRGEIIISIKNFNAKLASYMSNARNTASGLVNSKTVDQKVVSVTDFVAYAILSPRMKYEVQLKMLTEWGFNVVVYKKVKSLTDDVLTKYLNVRKKSGEYEMDGIVCVDDSVLYEHRGGYPEHMRAFKMITADQMTDAIVEKVNWTLSMDGFIKPTISIKPVKLVGVMVKAATAHNAKYIVDNKIGPGSKIKIIRSNDVIPYIMEVLQPATSGEAQMPEYDYKWNASGVDLVVKKIEGGAKRVITIKLIMRFFDKIGVKYLGEGLVTKIVDNGYDSIAKILVADREDLAQIDGLGDTMVDKIYDDIDRAFDEVELVTFMSASRKFGRSLGEKKIQKIINVYPDILKKTWKTDEMIEKIIEIKGFDTIQATLFTTNLDSFKKFYKEISKIKDLSRFEIIKKKINKKNAMFTGKILVFTGKRDKELMKLVEDNGGEITTAISKNTSYLVYDDDADKGHSKFEKAEKNNVTMLSKTEFKNKYSI